MVDETTRLLPDCGDDLENPVSAKQTQSVKKPKKVSFRQVLTPQSVLILMAYGMMALHSMAFDSLFPVFLHHPKQEIANNPDVQLPFKFAGGFGYGMLNIYKFSLNIHKI